MQILCKYNEYTSTNLRGKIRLVCVVVQSQLDIGLVRQHVANVVGDFDDSDPYGKLEGVGVGVRAPHTPHHTEHVLHTILVHLTQLR